MLCAGVHFAVCALVVAALAPSVCAEPADSTTSPLDTVYTVAPIVIDAPRVPLHVDDVFLRSGFVAVLDMGERRGRVEDLSTVLAQTVGVRVRQYGGLGSFATVSIRGSSSNQVDVYLDGVPLADAYTGVTNIGDLPLDGLERIEVYRGFTPPQLGSSSIGGAVNLVAASPDSAGFPNRLISRLKFDQSYGSYGTSRHVVSLWSAPGPARVFLHGSYMRSDGNFEFVDDLGTPQNPLDDRTAVRINNDFETLNILGRVRLDIPRAGNITLSHNSLLREQGVPGPPNNQSATARADRTRHLTYVRWTAPTLGKDRLQTFVIGHYSTANEQFHDTNGELGFVRQDTDNIFHATGGSLRMKLKMPVVPLALEALYEGSHESFAPRDNLAEPSEGPERNRVTHQGSVSGDLYIFGQNLVLTATQHFISQTTEFYNPPRFPWLPPSPQGRRSYSEQSPRVGFRWHPLSFATIKGNFGRYVRQPTMLELFGNTGSITGSADLIPERGENRDIGILLSADRIGPLLGAFLEVVYLHNDVDDLILFFPNSHYTSRPQNINSARIRGWEVSFSTQWREWLRVAGNYTYLDSRDTGPIPYYYGNRLPGRPLHDAALFIDTMWRRWRLSYELHRIGSNYLAPANFGLVPAREIHNLALRAALSSDVLSATAGVTNLGGNQIRDVDGFPLPGRSFYVTLSFHP